MIQMIYFRSNQHIQVKYKSIVFKCKLMVMDYLPYYTKFLLKINFGQKNFI